MANDGIFLQISKDAFEGGQGKRVLHVQGNPFILLGSMFQHVVLVSLLEYMAVSRDDLGSGSSPTFANSPTFESTLNLALTCTLHKPDTMSRFAPHRSSNSNPQDSVPAEGLHVRLQGRGRSVQDATSSDADVRKSR